MGNYLKGTRSHNEEKRITVIFDVDDTLDGYSKV